MYPIVEANEQAAAPSTHDALQRVLRSSQLSRSESMKRLLEYLWNHMGADISEYAIAVEALGRRSDFDPKLDAAVRVQISRLRVKLEHYYLTDGIADQHRLLIPMGSHALQVIASVPEASTPPVVETVLPPTVPAERQTSFKRRSLLLLLCLLVAAETAALLWLGTGHRREVVQTPAGSAGPITQFWSMFLASGAPVKIVLPTPVFFSYRERMTLHIRDTEVNEYRDWQRSEAVRTVTPSGSTPVLDHAYTVTSDTLAAIDLTRYLDRFGFEERVTSGVTGDSTMNLLEQVSVVALGGHSTLHPFQEYLDVMNFNLAQNDAWVENARPAGDEPGRFLVIDQGAEHRIEPGIIAVLPGHAQGRALLILQARHTSALVNMLSSQVGDNLFTAMHRAHGSPHFFEMVVLSDVAGDHVIRSWPVAMHAFQGGVPLYSGAVH